MPALLQDAFAGGTGGPFFSFPGGIGAPGLGPIITGGRRRSRHKRHHSKRHHSKRSKTMRGGRRHRRGTMKMFKTLNTKSLLKKLSSFFRKSK